MGLANVTVNQTLQERNVINVMLDSSTIHFVRVSTFSVNFSVEVEIIQVNENDQST